MSQEINFSTEEVCFVRVDIQLSMAKCLEHCTHIVLMLIYEVRPYNNIIQVNMAKFTNE
jgi:hypothetical protein